MDSSTSLKKTIEPYFTTKQPFITMKTFLIDPGHGVTTRGKQSPDGLYKEWAGNRRIARRIVELAKPLGLECHMLFDSDSDLALSQRVEIANRCDPRTTVLVSVHSNASGNGSCWMNARGFSAFVAPNASATSRMLARILVEEAHLAGLAGNRAVPPQGYWTASLAVCRDSLCPAVLTENLFHDNIDDLRILQSQAGVDLIARIHLEAFLKLLRS